MILTRIGQALYKYAPVMLLAVLWEAAVRMGLVSATLLPPFSEVLSSLARLFSHGAIFDHGWISLVRLATGLTAAIVVGVLLGLFMGTWRLAHLVFQPFLNLLYPMPKSALIPLMMILFGLGDTSKVLLIFMGCLLPVVVNTYNGTRGVDPRLIWSARNLGAGGFKVLWSVRMRAALPDILNGIRIAIAFSFILLVNAELIFGQEGIGYLVGSFGSFGEYSSMFATIIIIVAAGFVCDRLFERVCNKLLRWRAP